MQSTDISYLALMISSYWSTLPAKGDTAADSFGNCKYSIHLKKKSGIKHFMEG